MLAEHLHAIFDRLRCQVVVQPTHVVTVVLNALLLPKCLAHENSSVPVDLKRNRIGERGFGRREFHLHSVRNAEPRNRKFAFIRGFCDRRFVVFVILDRTQGNEQQGQEFKHWKHIIPGQG